MVVTSSGLNRMATLASSTWTNMGIGVGVTTSDIGDTALETSLYVKTIATITTSNNVVYFKGLFTKSDVSSASNVTEIVVADSSTQTNTLFRTVASTNTWTAFAKISTQHAIISTSLTVSS